MPRNTQRKQSAQATRQIPKSTVPAWVWLFTGAVLGAFVMFLIHLSDVQQQKKTPVGKNQASESSKPKANEPLQFEFYNLLKKHEVEVTERFDEAAAKQALKEQNFEFLLQVASFKSLPDAEQLRAKLLLLNLEATVQQADIRQGETWHRVIAGPYLSKSKLSKARSTLLSNGYDALTLKRKR